MGECAQMAAERPGSKVISAQQQTKSMSLRVPSHVEELRLDLGRERLIRLIGEDRRGRAVRRHLVITRKGSITVV
jgi:hypothetical protein